MIRVYKDSESALIYPIDSDGWIKEGWSLIPSSPIEELSDNTNKINLNTASVDELKSLPSIGVSLAKKIMEKRPYQSFDELPEGVDKTVIAAYAFLG